MPSPASSLTRNWSDRSAHRFRVALKTLFHFWMAASPVTWAMQPATAQAQTNTADPLAILTSLESSDAPRTLVKVRILDGESGKPGPAMVCISGTDGRVRFPPDGKLSNMLPTRESFDLGVRYDPDPDWIGPPRLAGRRVVPFWREPMMYLTSGDFSIRLPRGRWQIATYRGFEYVPVLDSFTVYDEQPMTRTVTLNRWIDMPGMGWYSGDVHVHHVNTEPAHAEFLIRYAMAEDLHVSNLLAMGDEWQVSYQQSGFGREHRFQRGEYCLVPGQEDPRTNLGHIIGLNLQSMVRDMQHYFLYDQVFENIHRQPGALAGYAHFANSGYSLGTGFAWYVTTEEVDFIELMQHQDLNTSYYYDLLNLGFRLTAAAGSDVPWGGTLGEVRTYVQCGAPLDADSWFEGLGRGGSFVTNGPMLLFEVNGRPPGSVIALDRPGKVHVTARALGHPLIGLPWALTICGNEGLVRAAITEKQDETIRLEFDLDVQQSGWLAARVACDNASVAHSSPVYVTVGGRRWWSTRRGPALAAEQLRRLDLLEQNFTPVPVHQVEPLRQRLNNARVYYENLAKQMRLAGDGAADPPPVTASMEPFEALRTSVADSRITRRQYRQGLRLFSRDRLSDREQLELQFFTTLIQGRMDPIELTRHLESLDAPPTEAPHEPSADQPGRPTQPATRVFQLDDRTILTMVQVPAGECQMGSPPDEPRRRGDEGPRHLVRFERPYYASRTEITQAQYEAVMGDNPSTRTGGDLPITHVAWDDCQNFCLRLGKRTGRKFRLPTESQWEYACRAGGSAAYAAGPEINNQQANFDVGFVSRDVGNRESNGPAEQVAAPPALRPVAAGPPNAWGLYDMHGNVWEWCEEAYVPDYGQAPSDGFVPQRHSFPPLYRVLRGGSWADPPESARSAARRPTVAGIRNGYIGFRVVMEEDEVRK